MMCQRCRLQRESCPNVVPCKSKLQRRGERRATINEEMGGVYDVNVLYRGYVQLTNTKNSKTNVYTFVLHRARLKSIMHPWRPTWLVQMGLLVDVSNSGAILPTPSRDSADVRSDTNVSRNRASLESQPPT